MDKGDTLRRKALIIKLSNKYKLPPNVIEKIVDSPYEFTYSKLSVLDLEEVSNEDEANLLKTNFNYKALGKLYMSFPALIARKNRKENASNINNKKWKK